MQREECPQLSRYRVGDEVMLGRVGGRAAGGSACRRPGCSDGGGALRCYGGAMEGLMEGQPWQPHSVCAQATVRLGPRPCRNWWGSL